MPDAICKSFLLLFSKKKKLFVACLILGIMNVDENLIPMSRDEFEVALPTVDIAAICRRFHVRRLDLVGSAARGADFDPAASDLDFVVAFDSAPEALSFAHFMALREALAQATGRQVDLIEAGSVANPYVLASMERDSVRVYGP